MGVRMRWKRNGDFKKNENKEYLVREKRGMYFPELKLLRQG